MASLLGSPQREGRLLLQLCAPHCFSCGGWDIGHQQLLHTQGRARGTYAPLCCSAQGRCPSVSAQVMPLCLPLQLGSVDGTQVCTSAPNCTLSFAARSHNDRLSSSSSRILKLPLLTPWCQVSAGLCGQKSLLQIQK